jgi:hypothetical protein
VESARPSGLKATGVGRARPRRGHWGSRPPNAATKALHPAPLPRAPTPTCRHPPARHLLNGPQRWSGRRDSNPRHSAWESGPARALHARSCRFVTVRARPAHPSMPVRDRLCPGLPAPRLQHVVRSTPSIRLRQICASRSARAGSTVCSRSQITTSSPSRSSASPSHRAVRFRASSTEQRGGARGA